MRVGYPRWRLSTQSRTSVAAPARTSYFGLLRDNYPPKPAFAVYRRLIARYGAKTG